jgi:hypothetical protein
VHCRFSEELGKRAPQHAFTEQDHARQDSSLIVRTHRSANAFMSGAPIAVPMTRRHVTEWTTRLMRCNGLEHAPKIVRRLLARGVRKSGRTGGPELLMMPARTPRGEEPRGGFVSWTACRVAARGRRNCAARGQVRHRRGASGPSWRLAEPAGPWVRTPAGWGGRQWHPARELSVGGASRNLVGNEWPDCADPASQALWTGRSHSARHRAGCRLASSNSSRPRSIIRPISSLAPSRTASNGDRATQPWSARSSAERQQTLRSALPRLSLTSAPSCSNRSSRMR